MVSPYHSHSTQHTKCTTNIYICKRFRFIQINVVSSPFFIFTGKSTSQMCACVITADRECQ